MTLLSPAPLARVPAAVAGDDHLRLLAALVRDIAARTDTWRPKVRFRPGERWWTRLDGPDGVDVWLLSWLSSQSTELHDHGSSAAAFTVVQGQLTEVRCSATGLVSERIGPGEVKSVAPGVVHDVDNRSVEPAVSIHAYGPRLARMTFYSFDDDTGLTPVRTVRTDEPEEAR